MNIANRADLTSRATRLARECDLRISVLRHKKDILEVAPAWWALEAIAPGATLFQSFEWCRNSIEHFGHAGEGTYRVYCVYDDNQLVGLLPLKIVKSRWGSVLTGLTEPFQQYTEMLAHPARDAKEIFNLIWAQLASSGADYMYLGHVRSDGPLIVAGNSRLRPANEPDAAPYVDLEVNETYDAYFKTIKTKTRKNMRNSRNKLARRGEIHHQYSSDGRQLADVIDRTYAGRLDWQQRQGRMSGAFQDPSFKTFLDRFKAPEYSQVDVLALSLLHNGKPIAEQWGFVVNQRYYAYISAWDMTYEDVSPGRMHLGEVVKTGYGENLRCLDFMAPNVPYKLTWTTGAVGVQDFAVAFTLKGKLFATLWLNGLRPWVKSAAVKLPAGLRARVVQLFFGGHS